MKIEETTKNRIIVSLSEEDLLDLGITYEDMDYKSIETRRVIYTVLNEVNSKLGRDIHPSGKMLIEAIPDAFGGCILYFTIIEKDGDENQKLLTADYLKTYLCEFSNENYLIDAARIITTNYDSPISSELYSSNGSYRMIMTIKKDSNQLKKVLREYAKFYTENDIKIAQTREYWKNICDTNAVEKLGTV